MQEFKINSNPFQIYLPGKFLPHKNHIEFFQALAGLSNIPKISVVITEVPENIPNAVREIVAKHPEMELKLTGNLTDQELVKIYSGSDLVVITSLYESSSLPILEAVACGARVLASSIPPHLEMASNLPIAIYESENCLSLQKSLVEILDQVQSGAKAGATDNIEIYAWENIAKIYLETFRFLIDVPNL
jgi:glycosyltransferase involved in cell wall biosynthesis